MREIKFRFWDKENNIITSGYSLEELQKTAIRSWFDVETPRQVELMQYTGLKDKNGKEIYEGDILQRVTVRMGREHRYVPFEVKFEAIEGEQGIYGWGYLDTGSGVGEFEVIGNIYENPELIKN